MEKIKDITQFVEKYSPNKYSIILILPIFTLVAGFIIWSIYLYSLGFVINDLIRTRFILTGFVFIIITYLIYFLIKNKIEKIITFFNITSSRFLVWFILSFCWLFIYSILLFPKLPLLIGGGQPKALALVLNENGLNILQSFNFKIPEGAKYQTEIVCIAYDGVENFIIIRDNRILSLDKSLVIGFISLPGDNSVIEKDCIWYASEWAWKGSLYGVFLFVNSIYILVYKICYFIIKIFI